LAQIILADMARRKNISDTVCLIQVSPSLTA